MRVKLGLALWLIGVLTVGMLILSGCSGGSSSTADQEPSTTEPIVATNDQETDEETASVQEDEASVEEDEPELIVEPVDETPESKPENEAADEESTSQPLMAWARDAGGLNHCDRMSIFPDGSVEAVVCRAATSEPTVVGTLSDEQLAQVTDWVSEYSSFTRREQEMSRAVRTTTLNGTGVTAPESEIKKEIAAFAAALYFELTGTE